MEFYFSNRFSVKKILNVSASKRFSRFHVKQ